MASKLCDSCKSATAALFCRPDSAFLCLNCDSKIHAANKLASRHPRVWVCEVCEQAPAHVTCKADAAALCVSCDRDIHSANPLARRHDRVPIVPFYDSVSDSSVKSSPSSAPVEAVDFLNDRYFADEAVDVSREEAEAASWLLPNAAANNNNNNTTMDLNTGQFLFHEMDPSYLDLEYVDPKMEQNSSGADGVVPESRMKEAVGGHHHQAPLLMNDDHCFDLDFSAAAAVDESKGFPYGYNHAQCLSHSLSSSSMEVGVVPEGSVMTDISNSYGRGGGGGMVAIGSESSGSQTTVPLSAVDREARVLRYREKRKNRKFEKTIRYASRKAYAETRPRIKGRFAKRTDADVEAERNIYGFGVVPSF
ncbi:Zinc finger protein CONSTANS-LIKE 4 [Linum grandiflorum]